LWPLLLVAAVVAGLGAGRLLGWWALLLIAPVAMLLWSQLELEADIRAWIALVFSVVLAAAIVTGIGLQRIRMSAGRDG